MRRDKLNLCSELAQTRLKQLSSPRDTVTAGSVIIPRSKPYLRKEIEMDIIITIVILVGRSPLRVTSSTAPGDGRGMRTR